MTTFGRAEAVLGHGAPYSKMEERPRDNLVTMNVRISASLLNQRINAPGASGRFAPTRLGGVVANKALLNIRTNDMMFANSKVMQPGSFMDGNIEGFSSFNGMPLEKPNETQRDFEKRFKFLGFAQSEFGVTSAYQPQNGLAVQVRGALCIMNNGTTSIRCRDLLKWRLPKINTEERFTDDEHRKMGSRMKGVPVDKYSGIVEPYHGFGPELMMDAFQWLSTELDNSNPMHTMPTPGKFLKATGLYDTLQTAALHTLWLDGAAKLVLGLQALLKSQEEGEVWTLNENRIAQLQKDLGLSDGAAPNIALVKTVLKAQYASLLPTNEDQEKEYRELTQAQRPMARTYVMTSARSLLALNEEDRSKIFGTALQDASPGQPFDILI